MNSAPLFPTTEATTNFPPSGSDFTQIQTRHVWTDQSKASGQDSLVTKVRRDRDRLIDLANEISFFSGFFNFISQLADAFIYFLFAIGIADILFAVTSLQSDTADKVIKVLILFISGFTFITKGSLGLTAIYCRVWHGWHENHDYLLSHVPEAVLTLRKESLPPVVWPTINALLSLALYCLTLFDTTPVRIARGSISIIYGAFFVLYAIIQSMRTASTARKLYLSGSQEPMARGHVWSWQPLIAFFQLSVSSLEVMVECGHVPSSVVVPKIED